VIKQGTIADCTLYDRRLYPVRSPIVPCTIKSLRNKAVEWGQWHKTSILLLPVPPATAGLVFGLDGADGEVGHAGSEIGDPGMAHPGGDKNDFAGTGDDGLTTKAILGAAFQDVENFLGDVFMLVGRMGGGVRDVGAVNV
jgi:hypothetical protein